MESGTSRRPDLGRLPSGACDLFRGAVKVLIGIQVILFETLANYSTTKVLDWLSIFNNETLCDDCVSSG